MLVIDANRHAGLVPAMTEADTSHDAVEITLGHMEEAGIDRSVLSAVESPNYEKANRQVAEICKQHPGKFIGFARHHPAREKNLDLVLRKEIETLAFSGIMMTSQPTRRLLEVVAELRLPVLYQNELLEELHMAAQEFPQVPFIVTGLGNNTRDFAANYEAIDIARRYPNVYLTTAVLGLSEYLEIAARELGAGKLIFASDGPERDSRVERHRVRLLKLRADDEAMVLGGNLQRLLPTR